MLVLAMAGRFTEISDSRSVRYHLVQPIARGGMGEVWVALRVDNEFKRLYALKRLRGELRDDPAFRAMFIDEARLAGLVRHPNVVSVLDVGEDAEGPFLVMDLVDGVSASFVLKHLAASSLSLPVQLAARIVAQAAEGLHAVHGLSDHDGKPLALVHRDVSPQNILLGFDGTARITDFGIAKGLGRATKTTTGLLKGKAGYMSPEQLRFDDLDRRSDLFSLGVVLYELLAGGRLYHDPDPTLVARRILREPPPDIDEVRRDVHPAIVQLTFELLAKEPSQRPKDAHEVASRLDAVVRELEGAEGVIGVREFLEAHFGDERAEMRESRQKMLAELESRLSTTATRARRMRRAAVGVGVAAAIAACVGAAIALGGEGADESAPAVEERSTAERVTAVAERAAEGEPDPEREGDPSLDVADGPEPVALEGPEEPPSEARAPAEPARTREPRRAAARERRVRRPTTMGRVPMRAPASAVGSDTWEWQE